MNFSRPLKSPPAPVRIGDWRHVVGRDTVPRWSGVLAAVCLLVGMFPAFGQGPNEQTSIYAIDGLALGARIPVDSPAYREYKCGPSDQFDGFTWCQKTRLERERGSSSNFTYSVLHSRRGSVVYVNRYQVPAFIGSNGAEREIQSYTRKFGESPATTVTMPHRSGLDGVLAAWGKIVLEPLDVENRKAFAEGRRLGKGYYVDFIGNFDRSAKEGFPLYRISGGAGFIWVASFDQRGRGTLRLVAVDAGAFYPDLVANSAPSEQPDSSRAVRVENPPAAERPAADTDIARQGAEKAADKAKADSDVGREEAETAKRDAQLAAAEIEKLNAERTKLNAALERLETDKAAAEGKAHTMQSVAYGAILIALLAIVSSLFFVGRRRSKPADRQSIGPGMNPLPVAERSPLAETQLKSSGGESQPAQAGSTRSSLPEAGQASTLNAEVAASQSAGGALAAKPAPGPDTAGGDAKPEPPSDTVGGDVRVPTEKVDSEAKPQTVA
jgi:hypothetical protein